MEKDTYTFGFDAQSGEFGNLITKGIIDPTKVVRTALQDAASVAGLLVTTEAMVAELPQKKSPPTVASMRPTTATHDNVFDFQALLHPGTVFEQPKDVVAHPDLTLAEKRAILASWASDDSAIAS